MVKYHFGYNYLTNLFTCPHDSLKNTPKCVKLTKRQTETRTCKLKITSTPVTVWQYHQHEKSGTQGTLY